MVHPKQKTKLKSRIKKKKFKKLNYQDYLKYTQKLLKKRISKRKILLGRKKNIKKSYKKFKKKKIFLINQLSKTKSLKNVKYSQAQEIISENTQFLKKNSLYYLNPNIFIQSLRNFIKLISLMKNVYDYKKINMRNFDEYKNKFPKFIFIFTKNILLQKLLKTSVSKMKILKKNSLIKFMYIGGMKDLIHTTKLNRSKTLIIFLEHPEKSLINFCTSNQFYILSIFSKEFSETLRSYGSFIETSAFRRAFWLLNLIKTV